MSLWKEEFTSGEFCENYTGLQGMFPNMSYGDSYENNESIYRESLQNIGTKSQNELHFCQGNTLNKCFNNSAFVCYFVMFENG